MLDYIFILPIMCVVLFGIQVVSYLISDKHYSELTFGSKPWWDSVDKDKPDSK